MTGENLYITVIQFLATDTVQNFNIQ